MTIEIAKVLAIVAAIVSALVTTILALFKWVKQLIKERNDRDAAQIQALEEDLDTATKKLDEEKEARLKDQRDYSNGVIALSHRFREAVMAVVKWPKK